MPAPPPRALRPGTLILIAAVLGPHQPGRDKPPPRTPPARAASGPGWAQGHRREERGWRAVSGTAPEPSAVSTAVLKGFLSPDAV